MQSTIGARLQSAFQDASRAGGATREAEGAFGEAEAAVQAAVQWLRLGVESVGAAVVGVGVVVAIWGFVHAGPVRGRYNSIRLTLARFLAVALEFQLASDILSTAIAPTWDQIGKLGAIAVIRTTLNYFLSREMEAEQRELAEQRIGLTGAEHGGTSAG